MLKSRQLFQSISSVKAPEEQEAEPKKLKKNILVVDDDPYILRALSHHLNDMGYDTVPAPNGDAAIKKLNEAKVDLIISDVVMPGMNGHQFCQLVKSNASTSQIPFIFISAKDQLPDKLVGFQTGADDYITKPFELSELKVRIESLLRRIEKNAPVINQSKVILPSANYETPTDFSQMASNERITNVSAQTSRELPPIQDIDALKELEKTMQTRSPERKNVQKVERVVSNTYETFEQINSSEAAAIDYETLFSVVEKTIEGIKNEQGFEIDDILEASTLVLKSIRTNNNLILQALSNYEYDPFKSQLVNVCIFSMKIGIGLKMSDEDLIKLGAGALIHDVGHLYLPGYLSPEDLNEREDKLSQDELDLIKSHPLKGIEILSKFIPDLKTDYKWLYNIVLQEHERENGSGYPHGLKGSEISLQAKVIGIADTFESLAHKRTYKKDEFITYVAMQKIIKLKDRIFDSQIIKSLINEISLFPLDSYLKINTGEIGKVIQINHQNPLRPVIKIIYDKQFNKIVQERVIDLKSSPFIFVVKPIYDLSYEMKINK